MMEKITRNVYNINQFMYLIRINGEEVSLTKNYEQIPLIIDSYAKQEIKNLEQEYDKVFREDFNQGTKIHISTQRLGKLYNGSVNVKTTIDFIKIDQVEFREPNTAPIPPPMPTQIITQIPTQIPTKNDNSWTIGNNRKLNQN